MHILLIHQAFTALDEAGGTRHYELARFFTNRGHRVTVLTGQVSYLTGKRIARGWLAREENDAGVTVLRSYTYPAYHRSFLHRMLGFFSFMISSFHAGLRVRDVDLVWGSSPPLFQGVTALWLARIKRVPFLFEVRDLWPAFAIAVGVLRNRTLILMSEWLEKMLYRNADQVVVNSPGFREHVRQRGAGKIALVPNGVEAAMFDPENSGTSFRRANHLEQCFIVLYAGAHGMSNDLDVVLEAANRLRERENVVFVLLGDGKEKPALMAKAAAMDLSNVRFLPPVPKQDIPNAIAAADACIAILKPIEAYKTTYPNKVFDYMAAGRPVLIAIDGVIRSVVEGAGAGLFVPPGDAEALADAVCQLEQNPDLRMRQGRAGRKVVSEGFDRPLLAARMLQVMEELVQVGAS